MRNKKCERCGMKPLKEFPHERNSIKKYGVCARCRKLQPIRIGGLKCN